MARPKKHERNPQDAQLVRSLVLLGHTEDEIGSILQPPISRRTLRRHYAQELDNGKARMLGNIVTKAYQKALEGDSTMICFILKTKAGWREKGEQKSEKRSLADLIKESLDD